MQVIVNKEALESLINKVVKEDRSFHTKNVNELEKAAPPILPQPEMAQQLSTTKMPVEDDEFVPTNLDELGKATMQLSHKVEDELIEKFYNNFKTLVKKFEAMNEARLPSFQGAPVEEPTTKSRAERRAARRAELLGADEPETPYIPSTPAEDAEDIAGSVTPPRRDTTSPENVKRRRAKKSAGAETTTKSARSALETPASGEFDPVAEYLKSLYKPRQRPEWLQNVTMSLSDMVVGDANKLLAAIIKKMGEVNVTVESLEAAAMDAINNLTYSIDGDNIVITSPEYKVKFTYNTEGNPQNLFSLEQYQENLKGLTSQTSGGVGSQESWGPKYAAAIRELTYARNDSALETALFEYLPKIQETLTDAVLDSYPPGTEQFNAKEVADKLDVANDQIVDAFIQQGVRPGINTVNETIFGKPVEVSLVIPETDTAMQAIEDSQFGNVLLMLLSATPDELRVYVGKKKRTRRSALQMTRSEENYFYDLGMKIGGKDFKMSATEFQERLQNALEARDESGLDLSDEDIINMILTRVDIIDANQIEILAKVQDYAYSLFEKYMQSNPALLKQFSIDKLLEVIPEDLGGLRPDLREVFDKFFKEIIMAYTNKNVVTPFFKTYDAIVNDPMTKQNFKDTAGVKHSQIYDQPGAGRRAKDITNFVGNLRHISEFMKSKAKTMRSTGSTILAGKLERAAAELVDADVVADSFRVFFKNFNTSPVKDEIEKVIKKSANEILKLDLTTPTSVPTRRTPPSEAPSLAAAADIVEPSTPSPVDPAAINKTYDDIIASFTSAAEDVKEMMLDDFEEAADPEGAGPSSRQRAKYPALATAADYAALVNKLTQLKETTARSLLLNLIHGYTRG